MQQTAISNPYDMQAMIKDRTEILFETSPDQAQCYGCGRTVHPRIIRSPFLGTRHNVQTGEDEARSIAVCPCCNTVIQAPPEKPSEQKPHPRTVFVWSCFECGATFPEGRRLPVTLHPDGVTTRSCTECGGRVYLVEKRS